MVENLIKLTENNDGELAVMGRDLYEFLEVKTRYDKWIGRLIEKYEFVEDTDFILVVQKRPTNNPKNPYTECTNHVLTMDTAKELAMVTNNDKGKEARQYFIQAEKERNSLLESTQSKLPQTYSEALRALADEHDKKEQLELQAKENQPKVEFHDRVSISKDTLSMEAMAKLLHKNGADIGRNNFYKWCRSEGLVLQNATVPTQRAVNLGILETAEVNKTDQYGNSRVFPVARVTAKGQKYFLDKFKDKFIESAPI